MTIDLYGLDRRRYLSLDAADQLARLEQDRRRVDAYERMMRAADAALTSIPTNQHNRRS